MTSLKPRSTTHLEPDPLGLSARLKKCLERGKLTIADLALWLGRPFPTVRMWVNAFTYPSGPRAAGLWPKLTRLEKMIHDNVGFRSPMTSVTSTDRGYIKGLLNGRARLPGSRAAKRGRRSKMRVRSARKSVTTSSIATKRSPRSSLSRRGGHDRLPRLFQLRDQREPRRSECRRGRRALGRCRRGSR